MSRDEHFERELQRYATLKEWLQRTFMRNRNPDTQVVVGTVKLYRALRFKHRSDENFEPHFIAHGRTTKWCTSPSEDMFDFEEVEVELLECGHWFDPAYLISGSSWSRRCHQCEDEKILRTDIGQRAAEHYHNKWWQEQQVKRQAEAAAREAEKAKKKELAVVRRIARRLPRKRANDA